MGKLENLDIQSIMNNEAGRRVIYNIIELSGYWTDTYHSDPLIHARNAGRRAIGILLHDTVKKETPGSYIKMLQEHENG